MCVHGAHDDAGFQAAHVERLRGAHDDAGFQAAQVERLHGAHDDAGFQAAHVEQLHGAHDDAASAYDAPRAADPNFKFPDGMHSASRSEHTPRSEQIWGCNLTRATLQVRSRAEDLRRGVQEVLDALACGATLRWADFLKKFTVINVQVRRRRRQTRALHASLLTPATPPAPTTTQAVSPAQSSKAARSWQMCRG
eukprot:366507-Chlamydomonas_euryale.AAC.6